MKFHVRLLGPENAAEFRALRLEALARHPCAFAAAHDEEFGRSAADVAERLTNQAVFGGFVDDGLVGVAGPCADAARQTDGGRGAEVRLQPKSWWSPST